MPVLIIDTEGLGAFDEDENHDTKIFMLALLLWSLLLYNSIGTIDENALNNLSLVVNLSKSLQLSNKGGDDDLNELAKHFPSFLWILRDFSLKLEDEYKNQISPKEYLENSLKEKKGTSDQIESKNRIRRLIKHFFEDRDCSALIRPMEEETDLQCLNDKTDHNIRPEFISQLYKLRKKVFAKVKPKKLNGQFLNGRMVAELAMAYVDALNNGKVPTILSAWDFMVSEENQRSIRSAYEFWKKSAEELQKKLPISNTIIESTKIEVFKRAEEMFTRATISGISKEKVSESLTKIKLYIDERFQTVFIRNSSLSSEYVQKFFETNFRDAVRQNLRSDKYQCDEDYEKDLKIFKETFRSQFEGDDFEKYLDDILNKFNQRVYRDISSIKVRRCELEVAALQERLKRSEADKNNIKEEFIQERKKNSEKYDVIESEK